MQKIIFDLPLFRSTDPETSRQVTPMKVGSHRAILLAIYADATLGLTDRKVLSTICLMHTQSIWELS